MIVLLKKKQQTQLFGYTVTKYYLSTRNKNAMWTDLDVLLCFKVYLPFIILNSCKTAYSQHRFSFSYENEMFITDDCNKSITTEPILQD